MARQDYVTHSPNKKKNPYKPSGSDKSTSVFSTKFKIIITLTLLAIAGFSYLLWTIKDTQPLPVENTSTPTQQHNSAELPAPPTEKWDYMDDLKNKEVEVGKYEVENKGPYKMQCGSFKTSKQAEVLKANIAFVGLSAKISESKGTNGTWYKVFLGPYERKRTAEKDKHKLKNNNINYCQIWLWK